MKVVSPALLEHTTIKTHVNVNVFKIVNVKLPEMSGMIILTVPVAVKPKIVEKGKFKMARTVNVNALNE
jgi:hypothetical protein